MVSTMVSKWCEMDFVHPQYVFDGLSWGFEGKLVLGKPQFLISGSSSMALQLALSHPWRFGSRSKIDCRKAIGYPCSNLSSLESHKVVMGMPTMLVSTERVRLKNRNRSESLKSGGPRLPLKSQVARNSVMYPHASREG